MKFRTDNMDIYQILDLVQSRMIPLSDLSDAVIKNCSYEDLVNLKEELELLLFLLDIKTYCSYCKTDKTMNNDRKLYRREIKKTHTKVRHFLEKKKKQLPPEVQTLIDEFGGTLES